MAALIAVHLFLRFGLLAGFHTTMKNRPHYFIITLTSIFLGALFLVTSSHVQSQEVVEDQDQPRVMVIAIEEEISAGTVQFVARSLEHAQERGADLLLIKINTPGGLLKATEEISRLLLDSTIPTAVFVHKNGGWAFSAGTFILLSAEIAASHPNALIGAAQPRGFGAAGVVEPDEKILEASSGWIRSLAEARGRNVVVAEKFVRENVTLTGTEAREQNVIDFTASSLEEFLDASGFANATVETVSKNFFERVLSFFATPYLVPLLLGIGTLGLFFVFRTGEIEIGVVAAVALTLGLWGMGVINFSTLGMILLILGIVLISAEIFFAQGLGVFGIVGTIAFIFGILTFAQEPFFSNIFYHATFWVVIGIALGLCAFFILSGRLLVKSLKARAKVGSETLIGKTAITLEPLNPYGSAHVDRETWTAKNISENTVIGPDKEVEIVSVQGNVILVKEKVSNTLTDN
jgi:membrane-bound serine protease (ClpP class)